MEEGKRGLFVALLITLVAGASIILAAYVLSPETIYNIGRTCAEVLVALAIIVGIGALCKKIIRSGKR